VCYLLVVSVSVAVHDTGLSSSRSHSHLLLCLRVVPACPRSIPLLARFPAPSASGASQKRKTGPAPDPYADMHVTTSGLNPFAMMQGLPGITPTHHTPSMGGGGVGGGGGDGGANAQIHLAAMLSATMDPSNPYNQYVMNMYYPYMAAAMAAASANG
jgi:hypothetical protein